MIGAPGNEIVRLQLMFYINLYISINSFCTNSVVMKISGNQNSDGNIHYATVEITYSLDVSYYLQLSYYVLYATGAIQFMCACSIRTTE